jgi:hypothetical protein
MSFLDEIVEGGVGKPIFGKSIHSFLHPEEAYEKAADEYRRQYGQARQQSQGYIDPYNQQGLAQYGNLQQGINSLMNPEELTSKFTKGYETSPYAQQLLGLNRQTGLDEASKMGLMGSSAALGNIQQGAGNIVSQDREKYLKMMMEQYLQGLGLSQNVYNQGANMAGNYANNLLNQGHQFGGNMAGLAYNQQRAPGDMLAKLMNMGVQAYSGGMGGAGGANAGGGGFLS